MKESLKFIIGVLAILIISLQISPPVLADDVSAGDKSIALTINWRDDEPQDRPESITIEFYRHVDGEDVAMDSKTISSADAKTPNTWTALFNYYYGSVWEYAFKITSSTPRTALYSYRLDESGNGTNHYTFDFYYENGQTEMNIETIWEDDNDAAKERPERIRADLISLSTGEIERTVTLSGEEDHWRATVRGLKENPDSYYLIVYDLPANYSNVVTRGESSNTYICTNTYNAENTTAELTTQEMLSGALGGVVESIDIERSNRVLQSIIYVLIALIIIAIIVIYIIYLFKKSRGRK